MSIQTNSPSTNLGTSVSAAGISAALYAGTTGGTSSAYTATLAGFALASGVVVNVDFHTDCAAGATLNIGGTGAVAIYRNGYAVEAQGIRAGKRSLIYNGTQWDLLAGAIPIHPSVLFGNQSDGALSISSGTTTLVATPYYSTLTISGTGNLETAGYPVFADVIDLSNAPAGAIERAKKSGGTGGITGVQGTAGAVVASGLLGGATTGLNGGAGHATTPTVGSNGSNSTANSGGRGGGSSSNSGRGGVGSAGNGANGGTNPATSTCQGNNVVPSYPIMSYQALLYQTTLLLGGTSGGSGGGGNGDGVSAGGGGGGSGSGGGYIAIWCRKLIVGAGTAAGAIRALGGNGGDGGSTSGADRGAGGGGSGGGGGVVIIVCHELSGNCTGLVDVSGGAGGAGGSASGGGAATGGYGGQGGGGGRARIFVLATGKTYTASTASAGTAGAVGSANSGGTGGAGGAAESVTLSV